MIRYLVALGTAVTIAASPIGCLEDRVENPLPPSSLKVDAKGIAVSNPDPEPVVGEQELSTAELEELLGVPPMGSVAMIPSTSNPFFVPSVYPPRPAFPLPPAYHFSEPNFGFSPISNTDGLVRALQLRGDYPLGSLFVDVTIEYSINDGEVENHYNNLISIPKNETGIYSIVHFLPDCDPSEQDFLDVNIKLNLGTANQEIEIKLNRDSFEQLMGPKYESSHFPFPCDF